MSAPKTDLMKIALTACLSMLVTGAGAWMAFGRDAIDREEMVEYVNQQAPWVVERGEIKAAITSNSKDVAKLATAVQQLVAAQTSQLVELKQLVSKVDLVLDRAGK